jgi:hypothetical protein
MAHAFMGSESWASIRLYLPFCLFIITAGML